MRQRPVYVLNHSQHNFRKRTTQEDLDEMELMRTSDKNAWSTVEYRLGDRDRQLRQGTA